MDTNTVAVLGLGAMGSRVAQRLLNAGFDVTVWNRSPGQTQTLARAGAKVAGTAQEAVRGARVVLVCVRDDEASQQVWSALDLDTETVAVEMSTVTPMRSRELASAWGDRFVEAPMIGSRPQVEAGQLQLLVNGDPDTIARLRPVLEAVAGGVHVVDGDPGSAAVVKLAINGLLAVQLAAAGELLEAGHRAGVSPQVLAHILTALPVTSPALARSLPRGLAGDTAPNFPLELVAKDLGYLSALGTGPVIAGTQTSVAAALDAGREAEDVVALLNRHRTW